MYVRRNYIGTAVCSSKRMTSGTDRRLERSSISRIQLVHMYERLNGGSTFVGVRPQGRAVCPENRYSAAVQQYSIIVDNAPPPHVTCTLLLLCCCTRLMAVNGHVVLTAVVQRGEISCDDTYVCTAVEQCHSTRTRSLD